MLPVVALVGRPNVGKSTLFNQLTQSRDALVADIPGVTRDRQYGFCRLAERPFLVIDTGGMLGEQDRFAGLLEQQVLAAIDEADAVVFIMDARDGYTATDQEVLDRLRRLHTVILPVVNKVDGADADVALADFHATGLGPPLALAAAHRRGLGELLESLAERLPETSTDPDAEEAAMPGTRVAVVGRPNVGKSTLINRILGEERVMATEVPGTTRDTVQVPLTRDGVDYVFLDTAGLRRKSRVHETVEKFSAIKTLQAIEQCEAVLLVVDAQTGIGEQDATILGHVLRSGRALVIAVNKWDGLERHERTALLNAIDRKLGFADFAEIVPISALHGSGLGELFKRLASVREAIQTTLPTPRLSEILADAVAAHPPPAKGGRGPKMRYAHAGGRNPHRIIIHGSRGDQVPGSYRRYLANRFRQAFRLVGCPVLVEFRSGANPYERRAGKRRGSRGKKKGRR